MPGLLLRKKLAELHAKVVATAESEAKLHADTLGAAGGGAGGQALKTEKFTVGGSGKGGGGGRSAAELLLVPVDLDGDGGLNIELEEVADVPLDSLLRASVELVKPDTQPDAQLRAIMSANYDLKHQAIGSSRTVVEFVVAGVCEYFKLRARAAAKLILVKSDDLVTTLTCPVGTPTHKAVCEWLEKTLSRAHVEA